ncbi:hypothetical protein AB205_0044700 [Aquarana catesbeiana]|uniref:Uncharacterized protein n=1 Tax=Aquarana catesbeiana TaxID=8400 RepID=A0A2G9RHT5_AQUCT|nr:hypothetical protein AB205_0044700 [Aquarana catesbeiana]
MVICLHLKFKLVALSVPLIDSNYTGQSSLPRCIGEPWLPMTLSMVHMFSFLGSLLVHPDHCRLRTSHKSCS